MPFSPAKRTAFSFTDPTHPLLPRSGTETVPIQADPAQTSQFAENMSSHQSNTGYQSLA